MMRYWIILASAFAWVALHCGTLRADGGQVRAVQSDRGKLITVFTSPTPMCAGLADVSVAVQDAATGHVCDEAQTFIELKHRDSTIPVIRTAATSQAATNKLLRAAVIDLPAQGPWDVTVRVYSADSPDSIDTRFTMEVAAPWPKWITDWPWFCWPVAPILLFIVHRALVAYHPSTRQTRVRAAT